MKMSLIINFKKTKTEMMIVGTAERLNKSNENFVVKYRNFAVSKLEMYKYLDVSIEKYLEFWLTFS